MKISRFLEFFPGPRPIELAYGYTLDRDTIHINLYEDRLSRIVTDFKGNVIERVDQFSDDKLDVAPLLWQQKRFYPNRFNAAFKALLDAMNVYISITNVDAQGEPRFRF